MKRLLIAMTAMVFTSLPFVMVGAASAADVFGNDANLCARAQRNAQNTGVSDAEGQQPSICTEKNIDQDSDGNDQNPIYGPNGILTTLINILSLIAAIAAIIMIILAGLRYVTSSTNPQDVSNARERIIYALVGLAVAAVAQIIVRFIIGKATLI